MPHPPDRRTMMAGLAAALASATAPAPALARAGPVTVFAAASLKNALDAVASEFAQATGREAVAAFAGSSALARQIEHGAPADVFISANIAWMDHLERGGLINPATRIDLLGNRLVLIAHGRDAPPLSLEPDAGLSERLRARLGEGRLAMALVEAAPAGIYGKAALQSLGVWETVAPRVAQSDNVRAALALVALGEAPLGVVYASDARIEADVSVIGVFPEAAHPPIVYPAAQVAASAHPDAAAFLAHLGGPAAAAVFERQGFEVLRVGGLDANLDADRLGSRARAD